MEDLIIERTIDTPKVEFLINGDLLFEGKSCPIAVTRFYDPLFKWIAKLKAEKVNFKINLEYINSASVKKILDLLKELDANRNVKEIVINWHYEEGDDDSLETGQIGGFAARTGSNIGTNSFRAFAMTGRILIIPCILIALLGVPPTVCGAEGESGYGWAALKAVQPQEKLFVKLKDDRKVKGMFHSATDSILVLSNGDETAGYGRQDILEIRLGHGRSLKKSILIGTLIGAGAGAGLGGAAAASDTGYKNDGFLIPVGAAVGAIFGTAIGTVVGLLRGQGELIYKASQ